MSDAPAPIGLDEATNLQGDDANYSIGLDQGWEIWGPSGGYLAALTLRAAGRCAEIPAPGELFTATSSPRPSSTRSSWRSRC